MRKSYILDSKKFTNEFARCCREYNALQIAVAWCGRPNRVLPYKLLENFNGTISAIVGISFNHTHPDAIEWLIDICASIRVFRDDGELFHPKLYLFSKAHKFAIFIGSSNLTYGGFYANYETNCLIEGIDSSNDANGLAQIKRTIAKWKSQKLSFTPTTHWLTGYRKRYQVTLRSQQKQRLSTPPSSEENIPTASWLQHANWNIYYQKVLEGLEQREQNGPDYNDVLDAAAQELPIPWTIEYFKDIEKRRIMGGYPPYGWLGHVGASGKLRSLLVNGTFKQKMNIVRAINAISVLETPIAWSQLKFNLDRLVILGPTMKVWCRFLCIVRPDLFCTVSAVTVRQNLSKILSISQNYFERPEGYIQLMKLVHSSPWYNSKKPKDGAQAIIWDRRSAFMDAIFY